MPQASWSANSLPQNKGTHWPEQKIVLSDTRLPLFFLEKLTMKLEMVDWREGPSELFQLGMIVIMFDTCSFSEQKALKVEKYTEISGSNTHPIK